MPLSFSMESAELAQGLSAVAAGADGLLVEFHPDPDSALSDGDQSLPLTALHHFVDEIGKITAVFGRTFT